jgi:hypothetical protein
MRVTFPSKHQYLGLFKNGKVVTGQGRVTFPNNTKGACVKGNCIDGEGTLELEDGSVYTGHFLNCSRHGHGIYTFASGSKYEGEFLSGKRHGHGIFTYASGLTYEGTFRDGKRQGEGVFTFPNGDTKKVLFIDGEMVK